MRIQLKTSTPPGSCLTNSAPKIPYTTRQLKKQASAAKKLLKEHAKSSFPLLEARLDKIIKGYELMFNELVLARDEIRKYRANNEWQGQKRKRSTRQLAMEEGPPVQEGLESSRSRQLIIRIRNDVETLEDDASR